jgi:hypothetical protein
MITEKLPDLRARVRAPFRTRAAIEIAGLTTAGSALAVETRDANESGMRIASSRPLPQLPVILRLNSPGGMPLVISGSVIYSSNIGPDSWESGIRFNTTQPSLSTMQIDRYTYGS